MPMMRRRRLGRYVGTGDSNWYSGGGGIFDGGNSMLLLFAILALGGSHFLKKIL